MKRTLAVIAAVIIALLVGAWDPYPGPGTPPAPTMPPYPGPATVTPEPSPVATLTPTATATASPTATAVPTYTPDPCLQEGDCEPTSVGISDVGAGQVTPWTAVLLICIALAGLSMRRLWIWIRYE